MEAPSAGPRTQLTASLETGRIHSAYLFAGPGEEPRETALWFVRSLACTGSGPRPCEECPSCRRSQGREEIALDGAGRSGPLYRHVGDHPELLWVERGAGDTRVRIGQVRALQTAFRLQRGEGPRRAAVIADAEWLNVEAQNALLRLLEEPPPETSLVLVASSTAGLLTTVRSRCQRFVFRAERGATLEAEAAEERRALLARFDAIAQTDLPALLDWAEEYRGQRAVAAESVQALLAGAGAWLHRRVGEAVRAGALEQDRELDAFATLQACRRSLAQRNANPQMVAERALLALREAVAP